jgi:hypothetical protein
MYSMSARGRADVFACAGRGLDQDRSFGVDHTLRTGTRQHHVIVGFT